MECFRERLNKRILPNFHQLVYLLVAMRSWGIPFNGGCEDFRQKFSGTLFWGSRKIPAIKLVIKTKGKPPEI